MGTAFITPDKRLQTFVTWPIPKEHELSVSNSPMKLAEAGCIRPNSPLSDEVECIFCGAVFRDWKGQSPAAVHRILNPNCPFLNSPAAQKPTPISLVNSSFDWSTNHNTGIKVKRKLFSVTERSPSSILNVADIEHPFLPYGGYLMLFESHRLLTFEDPCSPCAAVFAKAGFVFSLELGSTVCVFCNIQLEFPPSYSLTSSDLESLHADKSPLCPFVRLYDVGNISRELERSVKDKLLTQHQKSIHSSGMKNKKGEYVIKHPEFEDLISRLGTFSSWPKLLSFVFPKEVMANCGLYYTGFNDKVKCYACGVGLYEWSPEAVPEEQHARASPHCVFLLQSRDKEFVDKAQHVQLLVEAEVEENISESTEQDAALSSTIPHELSPVSSDSSDAATTKSALPAPSSPSGSPVLDLGAIDAAMACQYTIEQISHAVHKFFVFSCGKYPNKALLLGTLKAADENSQKLCEKSHEIVQIKSELHETKSELHETKSELQETQSERQAKEAEYQAKEAAYVEVIQAKDSELQRKSFELEWHDLEVRTELQQQFVGQLQQQNEIIQRHREVLEQKDQALEQHREVIEKKDQALEQHREVIEHRDVQLEMKNKEVADLQRHIRSLRAELARRQLSDGSDDEESSSSSSDLEHNSELELKIDDFPVASCKVCLVKKSQIMFLPCKHLCCCDGCAAKLHGKNCPICRGYNTGFEKVYVP